MRIRASLNNQEQFIDQFTKQIDGRQTHCMNARSVIFPNDLGRGKISFIKHSYISFIVSNVVLNEEMVYKSPGDKVAKSDFVDFGVFSNGKIESSFLAENKQFRLAVPKGEFQHLEMNIPRYLIPKNKSCKELFNAFERFPNLPMVRTTIKELFNSNHDGAARTLEMESKGLDIASSLLLFLNKNQIHENKKDLISDYDKACIFNAKFILEENFSNPLTIKELSRAVGINELKLKNGFRQLFDITIRQFVIYLKMERAKELLGQSDISIAEVSYQIGYQHRGHFASTFKRFFGESPLCYHIRLKRS